MKNEDYFNINIILKDKNTDDYSWIFYNVNPDTGDNAFVCVNFNNKDFLNLIAKFNNYEDIFVHLSSNFTFFNDFKDKNIDDVLESLKQYKDKVYIGKTDFEKMFNTLTSFVCQK